MSSPDVGRHDRPEGGVLVIPTLLLTLLVIHKTLPRRVAAFDA